MNNLIITSAFNYKYKTIAPFIESLNENFTGQLILFTNKKYKIRNKSYEIISINPIKEKRGINKGFNTPNNFRYFWYQEYLKDFKNIANVFITDIRDVVFQDNPFSEVDDMVYVAEEDNVIENCSFNTDWIQSLYGDDYYNNIKNENIKCSGTLLAPFDKILFMVDYFVEHLLKYGSKLDTGRVYKILDQGIYHSFIKDHNEICSIKNNQEGVIFTMGHSKYVHFNRQGQIVNDKNKLYPIIHQYDRFDWISQIINMKY